MKTPLIALALTVAVAATTAAAVAATAATDQLVQPSPPAATEASTTVAPDIHRSNHAVLHADRERVKADKSRLKLARAARDDNAIRDAQATLQTDMDAWHADRERLRR